MKSILLNKLVPDELHLLSLGILTLISAFFLTVIVIPKLIEIVKIKGLMDDPNQRSSHKSLTPTLGGASFFITLMMGICFTSIVDSDSMVYFLIPAVTILFFAGLKDDLMGISAKSKIFIQILAVSIILVNHDLSEFSLHGFMGIYELHYAIAIPLIYIFFVTVINAINLIDGIDGLASLLGIFILMVFASFFYGVNLGFEFLISILIIGALSAFLVFNLSRKNKIFMGDTGSLVLGFIIAFQSLEFITMSESQFYSLGILPENSLLIIIGVLFIPLLDVLRVAFLRISKNLSPFKADRSHIHHVLIDSGLSHIKASATLALLSGVIFLIVYNLNVSTSVNIPMSMFLITLFVFGLISFIKNSGLSGKTKGSIYDSFLKSFDVLFKFIKNGTSLVLRTFL